MPDAFAKTWGYMKIAVIGAGIVGICTAYELAQDGHTVTVFERNGSVAEEASFACAGHGSASLSHPLAFPAWPKASRLRSLFSPSGIALMRGAGLRDLRWLAGWKATPKGFAERFVAAHKLVAYSQARQQLLTTQVGLAYEQSQGQLLLLRSEREAQTLQNQLTELNAQGAAAKLLSAEQARALEPALASDLALHGAIHFPNDMVGNCRQFAHVLKDLALDMGVAFNFGTKVTGISYGPTPQVHTAAQPNQSFEHVVLCAGNGTTPLLSSEFKSLPLTRVWSYSLSAQVREPLNAPRSAVLDLQKQIAISRMGGRIRVSGSAELGGNAKKQTPASSRALYLALQSHFPGAADFSRSMQLWKGASIFTPDALPLLGSAGPAGIWLNLAHGHNGWSMACGSARVLADQIAGKAADLDTTLMLPGRFKT